MGFDSQSGDRWPASVLPEILSLLAGIRDALEQLDDAIARLSVASRLAHEFRTPLTVLRGEAEVALSQTRSAEEYRKVLASSLEEYVNLSRIIDDMTALAPGESSETPINRGSATSRVRGGDQGEGGRQPRARAQSGGK